jgi:5'-nucleotidase (lipoprotein e(P4) family)
MNFRFSAGAVLALLFLLSFKSSEKTEVSKDPRLMSVAWFAFSAEKEACYMQTYTLAGFRLEKTMDAMKAKGTKPAIITDLDETVLDNSAWSVKVMLEGKDYPEFWSDWEKAAKAPAFPGAVEFFQKAKTLGAEVFYISNRLDKNLGYTIQNLKNLGLPNADSSHILLKTSTSNKIERRNYVLKNHEVIMLLGDNLADFDGIWEEKLNPESRLKAVLDRKKDFGRKFFVFPNPVYGTWKDAQLNYNRQLSTQNLDSAWTQNLMGYLKRIGF